MAYLSTNQLFSLVEVPFRGIKFSGISECLTQGYVSTPVVGEKPQIEKERDRAPEVGSCQHIWALCTVAGVDQEDWEWGGGQNDGVTRAANS